MLVNAVYDINALTITIEVNIRAGTQYYMPGLPDNAVKEGFQACDQCHYGFGFPRMLKQKFVVNLAPGDVKKEGSSYDLSIGILLPKARSRMMNSTDISITVNFL